MVLVPLGATEQHGPHLPLRTDWWLAHAVSAQVAARNGDVLLADPIPVGCSAHHTSFAGTVSFRVSTFISVLVDIAESMVGSGFLPVFVNGHGGNRAPLGAALQTLHERGVRAWGLTYFETIAGEAQNAFEGTAMGHAGALETSLTLALDAAAVRSDKVPEIEPSGLYPDPSLFGTDPVTRFRNFDEFDPSGVVGAPRLADRSIGEALKAAAVEKISAVLEAIQDDVQGRDGVTDDGRT